ncbi:HlyD family type I secretion periplasmic adaptor subunit [Sphingomonas sp. LHG3406-1]|uniref:HlyD family type I secretion periplasmic adaptor subunit n=1 Tax=Sphingomonas sp. LHG3406-1 TaxID=2804617 RepID=UPI00263A2B4E|nr:HlyD family type I secretion periplasmic adaptor subunit [Sphingomonas sp. LHG3406-1]
MNEMRNREAFRASARWQDTEDSPLRDARRGALVGGLFFVGLLGWAALTPLDAAAYGQGVVTVSGNRQVVQHREGGIISALFVTENQLVRKGAPLAVVSSSDLVAGERSIAGEVLSLLAMRARLLAESRDSGSVPMPEEFAMLEGDQRKIAETALAGQRSLFEARRASLRTEQAVLAQRIAQHGQQIGGIEHQMSANRDQQRLIGDELAGLAALVPKGFVSINRLRAVEREASALDGHYGSYRSEIARSREAIGETRLQMVSLRKQMASEVAGQLREVQARLDELQPRLLALREQVARSVVRAPASGRIVGMRVFTVGGVLAAGDTLMEVVPQDRDLVVQAKVAPRDADDLRVGMETQVNFTALQDRNLPILKGKVTKISADSLEDERTGQSYFRIEVVVPPNELTKANRGKDAAVHAGLPADVLIPLRRRSAFQYLFEPLTRSLWLAGREG